MLEQGRTLTLAERGGEGAEVVVAAPGFRLLATMNPGGDFGKKELSPALANRFTTIWVPAMDDPEEMHAILEARLAGVWLWISYGWSAGCPTQHALLKRHVKSASSSPLPIHVV